MLDDRKQMTRFLIFFVFTLITSICHSQALNNFICETRSSAKECKNCQQIGNIRFFFELTGFPNKVFLEESDLNDSIKDSFKDCDIENISNWKCKIKKIFSSSYHEMLNGKYFSETTYRMLDGQVDIRYTCAKK